MSVPTAVVESDVQVALAVAELHVYRARPKPMTYTVYLGPSVGVLPLTAYVTVY